MPCRARQADTSIIRAIDLEFATVYYAAHDLAYGMFGTSIKGAAAKRSFVRAYIEELTGAPAKDDEVDSLALDAELFALPMHIGPLCCLRGDCKLNKEEAAPEAARGETQPREGGLDLLNGGINADCPRGGIIDVLR